MASGEYAYDNPFGFSTKYEDAETALAYYGYRYYCPRMGRWVRRDPLGGSGGLNAYLLCINAPVTRVDLLGLLDPLDPNGPLTREEVEALSGIIRGALTGARSFLLSESGKAHRKLVNEAKKLVQETVLGRVRDAGCCEGKKGKTFSFSDSFEEVTQFGGKLFANPLAVLFGGKQWGPLNYNFYTVGKAETDLEWEATVASDRFIFGIACCYWGSATLRGTIDDEFEFRPNGGTKWKDRIYDAFASVWTTVSVDFFRNSEPALHADIDESWDFSACF